MARELQGTGEGLTEVSSPLDKVRALQRALYVAAKRNGRQKFPALFDRIARLDVLRQAWEQVRRNNGAAGIDGETIQAAEAYGVERVLAELQTLLKDGRYRPQAARRVYIPKPGRTARTRRSFIFEGRTVSNHATCQMPGLQLDGSRNNG